MLRLPLFLATATYAFPSIPVPNVMLGNSRGTAQPGLLLPAVGLGTGAYSNNPAVGYGQ